MNPPVTESRWQRRVALSWMLEAELEAAMQGRRYVGCTGGGVVGGDTGDVRSEERRCATVGLVGLLAWRGFRWNPLSRHFGEVAGSGDPGTCK